MNKSRNPVDLLDIWHRRNILEVTYFELDVIYKNDLLSRMMTGGKFKDFFLLKSTGYSIFELVTETLFH
jgi:hypothetical protein